MQVTNRKEITIKTLLILMTIWATIILVVKAIPDLKLIFRVTDSIIETIPYGYENIDEILKQIEIIYPIVYNIVYTLTFTLTIIFSIIAIFQPKILKILGIVITSGNITLLSLCAWDNFLTNGFDMVLINIKIYLVLTMLVAIIFAIISIKPKMFYWILSLVTLLRCFNTISLMVEHINHIGNIYVIFQCFSEIFILIPYCTVLLLTKNSKPIISISE